MAISSSSEVAYGSQASAGPDLIRNPEVRCPCCRQLVVHMPAPWTIELCRLCRRPLALVRIIRRPGLYRLRNVIELAGSIYGIATMLLVLSFVTSEMTPLAFAKAVTVLLFVIGSILAVDGVLSLSTSIDQTWRVTRQGPLARLIGAGKVLSGLFAVMLVFVGVRF